MSKKVTLSTPRYRVVFGDQATGEPVGEPLTVQSITRDLQFAETLFARHKWGSPSDQPIRLVTVSAYYALRRTGQIEGSFEQFESEYLEVSEDGGEEIHPTDADPTTD